MLLRTQLTVTELTLNKTSVTTLPATNETVLKHQFHSIKYGGRYNITLTTDVPGAIPSQWAIYNAPPILPPHQLTALYEEDKYLVFWQERSLPLSMINNTKFHYEVLVNEGQHTVNETTAKVFRTNEPPYVYPHAKTDTIYAFAVRLVTEEGYRSVLSEVFTTQQSGR